MLFRSRELFTPDEVRKLDNKKCIVFIRGFDPIMDNKYIPFAHPMFNQTADGKGKAYSHHTIGKANLIGPAYEILTEKAVKYYEKLKDKGENVFIDKVTYDEFMMLGDAELNRRFSSMEELEQKNKMNQELQNELEYPDETQNSSDAATGGNSIAGRKQIPREKPEWEDTISNRMLHWNYTEEQKQEVRKAMEAGITKAEILQFFYPDVSAEKMRMARDKR